jgi:2-aminoethylphosphonate-pyruvate transaminase
MVDMSATLIHHGHVRLLQRAANIGEVIVGLTTDEQIFLNKGYQPELSYDERKEILLAFDVVSEVVPTAWLITDEVLDRFNIDWLLHGSDNSNQVDPSKLCLVPRTNGVSSSELRQRAQQSLVSINNQKLMLTPGPASILHENLLGLQPLFGRGDPAYQTLLNEVVSWIKDLSGQDEVIVAQGSATFALEMAAKTFVCGKVLILSTGFYSDRLIDLLPTNCQVTKIDYAELDQINESFDWLMCVYTETSKAFKIDLLKVRSKANKLKACLYVDATGSIGLEDNHEVADVIGFSSCKGLFGLAGACFVAHKSTLPMNEVKGVYQQMDTHKQHLVTGPYHALASLHAVIPRHSIFQDRVRSSKEKILNQCAEYVVRPDHQPMLCTYLLAKVVGMDDEVILYQPRSGLPGSILCHLGEVHKASVDLLDRIQILPLNIDCSSKY